MLLSCVRAFAGSDLRLRSSCLLLLHCPFLRLIDCFESLECPRSLADRVADLSVLVATALSASAGGGLGQGPQKVSCRLPALLLVSFFWNCVSALCAIRRPQLF